MQAEWLTCSHNVDLSRAFEGTGGRVQRVLKKAMAGEPIKMGAIGGSSAYIPLLRLRTRHVRTMWRAGYGQARVRLDK
jgi:hypothetical protein